MVDFNQENDVISFLLEEAHSAKQIGRGKSEDGEEPLP